MRSWRVILWLAVLLGPSLAWAQEDEPPPGPAWKNQISFPDEPFASWTSPPYVKFTIITKAGYDPNLVYFQDSDPVRVPLRLCPGMPGALPRHDHRAVRRRHAPRGRSAGGARRGHPAAVARSAFPGVRHPTRPQRSVHARGDRQAASTW